MDRGRCLILATVTSVKDSTVVYPCCSECYSRLLKDTKDDSFWCSSCHLTYDQLGVCFRYRLSVVIAENNVLANVTAFGRALEPFFGISATSFNRFHQTLSDKCIDAGYDSLDIVSQALGLSFVGKQFWFGLQKTKGRRENSKVLSPPHLPSVIGNTALGRSVDKLSSDMVASQMIRVGGYTPTVIEHMHFLLEQQEQNKSTCNSVIKISATCFNRSRSFRLSNCSDFGDKYLTVTPSTRTHNNSDQSCLLSCDQDKVNMNWSNHESYISTSTSKIQDDTISKRVPTPLIADLDPNHTLPSDDTLPLNYTLPSDDTLPPDHNLLSDDTLPPTPPSDDTLPPNYTLPSDDTLPPDYLCGYLTTQNHTELIEQSIEILRNVLGVTSSQNQSMALDDSSFLLECDRMENITSNISNSRVQSGVHVSKADISEKRLSTNYSLNSQAADLHPLNESEHLHVDVPLLPAVQTNYDLSCSKIFSKDERVDTKKLKTNQCTSTVDTFNGSPDDSFCSNGTHIECTQDDLLCKQGSQNGLTNNGEMCDPELHVHVDIPKDPPPDLLKSGKLSVICEELWDEWSGCGDLDQLALDGQNNLTVHGSKSGEIGNSIILPQNNAGIINCDKNDVGSQSEQQHWENLPESEDLEAFLCDYDTNMNRQNVSCDQGNLADSVMEPDIDDYHLPLEQQPELNKTSVERRDVKSISGKTEIAKDFHKNVNTSGTETCDNGGSDSLSKEHWENIPESEDLEAIVSDYEQNRTKSYALKEIDMVKDNFQTVNRSEIVTCDNEVSRCRKEQWENLPESEDLEAFLSDCEQSKTKAKKSRDLTNSDCGELNCTPFKGDEQNNRPHEIEKSKDSSTKFSSTKVCSDVEGSLCLEDFLESEELEAIFCDYEHELKIVSDLNNSHTVISRLDVENEMEFASKPIRPSYIIPVRTEMENIPEVCVTIPAANTDFSTAKTTIVSPNAVDGIFLGINPELPMKCIEDSQITDCDEEHSMDLFCSSQDLFCSSQDDICTSMASLTARLGACSVLSDNSMHSPIVETQTTPDQNISTIKHMIEKEGRTSCRRGVTFSKRLSAISNVQLMDIRMRIAPNPTSRNSVTSKSCLKRQSTVFVFDKINESIMHIENKISERKVETPNLKVAHDLPYSADLFTPSPIFHRENLEGLPHSIRDSSSKKYSESTPLLFSQCASSARKSERSHFLTPNLSEANYSVDLFASPELLSQSQVNNADQSQTRACNQSQTSMCNQSQMSTSNQSHTSICSQSDWIPPSTVKGTRLCKVNPIHRTSLPISGGHCVDGRSDLNLPGEANYSDHFSTNLQLSMNITSCSADLFSPEIILSPSQPQPSRGFLRKNLFF